MKLPAFDARDAIPSLRKGVALAPVTVWGRLRTLGRKSKGASVSLRPPAVAVGPDRVLLGAALLLTALGIVMVFSASAALAGRGYKDFTYFLKREVIYAIVGLTAMWFAMRIDYGRWRAITYWLLALVVPLLVAVRLVGTKVNGAHRWFRLGPLSFQPSELAKVALVLYLSVLLTRKADQVKQFSGGFVPPLVITGLLAGLVLAQPDMGTAVILLVLAFAMLFVAGTRTSYILGVFLIAAPVAWQKFILGTPFRMRRMLAFVDPWSYCQNAGFQLCESLISIGSGGVFGVGLGESRQKLFFLPEAHTDFILAVIGEELGFVGIVAVLAAFVVLIWRGMVAALRARDVFGAYLAFGITTLIGLQALMNTAVVTGLMPTKGLALPFVSYGGSSLIVSLFLMGILANVSARNPEPRMERQSARTRASRNKRSEPLPRIVVEVGPPRKRRAPAVVAPVGPPVLTIVPAAPVEVPVPDLAVDIDMGDLTAPAPEVLLDSESTEPESIPSVLRDQDESDDEQNPDAMAAAPR